MIYGYFKNRVKAELENKSFKIPLFFQYLEGKKDKIKPITSFFTLVEVADNLKKELKLTNTEVILALRLFRKKYDVEINETIVLTGDLLQWFLEGIKMKDAIQLNIAKNLGILFLSRDKRLLRKAKKFYGNVLSIRELRKLIS